jgi:hypothetical protein
MICVFAARAKPGEYALRASQQRATERRAEPWMQTARTRRNDRFNAIG